QIKDSDIASVKRLILKNNLARIPYQLC
ncbi:hypothetical protein Q604_UNBC15970G0001, partial [human gut metagenome]